MSFGPPDEGGIDLFHDRINFVSPSLVSFLYGFTVTLSVACIYYLWLDKTKRPSYFYLCYTVLMFCLGTLHTFCLTRATQLEYVDDRNFPGGPLAFSAAADLNPVFFTGVVTYVVTLFLADGLLLWRVIVVYTGSRLRPFLALPCLMYLATISTGIVEIVQVHAPNGFTASFQFALPFYALSFAENVLMSGSIVLRLLFMRRKQAQLGHHGSPYMSIAAMVIESATLYAAFHLCFIVPYILGNPIAGLFIDMLGQIQIIAPLLIIYRVSRGRAWSGSTTAAMQQHTNISFAEGTANSEHDTQVESLRMHQLNIGEVGSKTFALKDMSWTKPTIISYESQLPMAI